jgi:hypothetical protein
MFVGKDPCESLTLAFEEHIFGVMSKINVILQILCIQNKENDLYRRAFIKGCIY